MTHRAAGVAGTANLERFPERGRPEPRPSAGDEAWLTLAERFLHGHSRRSYAACDGQDTAYPL
ncbi:MAG: hypothetical protein KC766_17210 [Myxococcales bacterium]|nr:hypothetical protein [Myxococcales bacterium]